MWEKSIHNPSIDSLTTRVRECGVEVENYYMNGTMESIVTSLINQTPYMGSSGESLFPLVLGIVR
jgi:hypothetical protein